jgi:hypothetical protein
MCLWDLYINRMLYEIRSNKVTLELKQVVEILRFCTKCITIYSKLVILLESDLKEIKLS